MIEFDTFFPFEGEMIRKFLHNEEWHFSVIDIVRILTESTHPKSYWVALRNRNPELLTICKKLKMRAIDGKAYAADFVNAEGLFRITSFIPSPKAEPLKIWFMQTIEEREKEAKTSELTLEQAIEIYNAKATFMNGMGM